MWKVARLVAWRRERALEPRDRLVELALLEEVRADVVVRVAEVGIDGDRLLALRDRVVETILETVRPAQERMRLGGGMAGDRLPIQPDRVVETAVHLQPVSLGEELLRTAHPLIGCAHRAPARAASVSCAHSDKIG